ncbi:MAG: cobalamin-independent methionine synthase II family protein [Gammaproteobacteria bacterium]|nr:cobalamin-independent methionine synthase II family protein [Gammaproteobacteria bacterium]
MLNSSDRIVTTHVGSLPRSAAVTDVVFAREREEDIDDAAADATIREAVDQAVRAQVAAGIDIVSDGEMSKISYATYLKDRVAGFAGDSPRNPPADLEDFPGYMKRIAAGGGTPTYRRPKCVGELKIKNLEPLHQDLDNFGAAIAANTPAEGFMNAPSPGVVALFQPNEFYTNHQAYLEALADVLRVEYEAIVDAGLLVQIDSPDLGLGRHTLFKGRSDAEYQELAATHVDVLNAALQNIPAERVRLHVCWGNYEGPHHHDASMALVLPLALKVKAQALLFESANPRHAHEWQVFRDADIPDDRILVPGVIDSTTNFIEHPELVAERILRFADIVGRERVIAGTDCGFATFAGFGSVDADITYAKLASLAEGARLASRKLWGAAA